MVDSTISNNFGPSGNTGAGEGIFANLTNTTIIHSTVAFNRLGLLPSTNSGNISWPSAQGALNFRESIIADSNNAGGGSCDISTVNNSVGSQGYNDVQRQTLAGSVCANLTGFQGTDLPNGTDPLLIALASNGGPTQTHALPGSSPAIDKVPTANCTNQFNNPILIDQRDSDRPAPVTGLCDMGAYEKANLTITPTTLPVGVRNSAYSTSTLTGHGGKAAYSFSIGSGALPNGLSLNSAGVISGTPTTIGSFTFAVSATDAYGATIAAPQSFTILVFAEPTSTITVNTNVDPGNVNCTSICSLRTALAYASSGDTIAFSGVSSPITLNNANGTLNVQSNAGAGNPNPLNNLIIQGLGAPSLAIDGNNNQTVFTVANGITATINNLTVQHGTASTASGGDISNSGTLTINNSTIANNQVNGGNNGGGIFSGGTLTVNNSTFSNNSSNGGGAIDSNGSLLVSNSTFAGNNSGNNGGAIYAGSMTISNSTFSGNSAKNGGGIFKIGGGALNLLSTIVSGNTGSISGPDIDIAGGTLNSLGHSFVGDGTGASGFVGSD
ncbi:MAG: choice-of-anchor Q domain-containing protein [Aggregatilineales bacterium]